MSSFNEILHQGEAFLNRSLDCISNQLDSFRLALLDTFTDTDRESRFVQRMRDLIEPESQPVITGAGLKELEFSQFLAVNQQLVQFALDNPRQQNSNLINDLLSQPLLAYLSVQKGGPWKITQLDNDLRHGNNRAFTFGQVPKEECLKLKDPEECDHVRRSHFAGLLTALNTELGTQKRVPYFIDAVATIVESRVLSPNIVSYQKSVDEMIARGPTPWRLQVEPKSDAARWIADLCGDGTRGYTRAGQVKEDFALGVFTEALMVELYTHGYTHMLLPFSRRDPPFGPGQCGAHMVREGNELIWVGRALDSANQLVELKAKVHCEVRVGAENLK